MAKRAVSVWHTHRALTEHEAEDIKTVWREHGQAWQDVVDQYDLRLERPGGTFVLMNREEDDDA